ncbi:MAG TPA: polysaccharide biosynthesis C-terminal domain-containing protein [Acidobacteriaceae bacterium]|jgi:O-antigen/teichoic acid export membrane protein
MLKRILKMLGAQGTSIGINLIGQFLLPPLFITVYGVAKYGEWLVLSATLAYLASLNFGITTYASNELTMLRQRGELDQYKRLQGSTLAFLLALVAVGAILGALIGLLPLPALLHLRTISRAAAGYTAFFLALQTMAHILGGYYNNLYMVVQETHRGQMWANIRYLAPILVCVPLAIHHASFPTIAFAQFAATFTFVLAAIIDLRKRLQGLPLGLHGANWPTLKTALRPSGMFAMVLSQQFLLFQVPVILLQRLLGPEIVVLFTISRTVLSTARRLLSTITIAIAPEITFSFGSGDKKTLLEIFHYSERVVFGLIPVANLGALLCSPVLLAVWLHKPDLFEPYTYGLMALISAAMSMREHKQFFQFSTNTHDRLAHIVFWGNLMMLAISIPMTIRFGLNGFMYTWLVSETTQMALLYRENRKLFLFDPSITMTPVLKLAAMVGAALPLCILLMRYDRPFPLFVQALIAVAGTVVLFAVAWFVFGLGMVRKRLVTKLAVD